MQRKWQKSKRLLKNVTCKYNRYHVFSLPYKIVHLFLAYGLSLNLSLQPVEGASFKWHHQWRRFDEGRN